MGVLAALVRCSGPACRAQGDCANGSYCEFRASGDGVSGTCISECTVPEDCSVDDPSIQAPVCSDDGHCLKVAKRPRLRVLDPENDSLLAEGVREVRLVGEVETSAAKVEVEITPYGHGSCLLGEAHHLSLSNSEPGQSVTLSFIVDGIPLDPGLSMLEVVASAGPGASDRLEHLLEVPCPGCPEIMIEAPPPPVGSGPGTKFAPYAAPGLLLPALAGKIEPAGPSVALWRVLSGLGDVFDGLMMVEGGRFHAENVPLFAGANRVQVVLTGVGSAKSENRCSRPVTAAQTAERGLRVLLTWDGATSDLDVHLVAPDGRFNDTARSLSARAPRNLGGLLLDDFSGLGPEVMTVESLPNGTYGLVVEPVFDDRDPGSNAFLRVLYDGHSLTPGPIGPVFLSAIPGQLWMVGQLLVEEGGAQLVVLNGHLPVSAPPTRSPPDWPAYY